MRIIGWFISWSLSIIVYLLWVYRFLQLNNFYKSFLFSFGMQVLGIFLGFVIVVGGSFLIMGIWYLIWRPDL